jgi:chondroitin AC lyase
MTRNNLTRLSLVPLFLVTFFLSLALASAALADTVTITKVEYKADRLEFKVEATSSDGGNVTLSVLGFGAMDYDSRKDKYKFRVKPVELPPCTAVVVSSGGGSDSRVTGANPCLDDDPDAPPPDEVPPTPNPPTFASPPSADSSSAISMTATIGSDATVLVEYSFVEVTGNSGGSNSGWQESASYTDTGLDANTEYTYTVQLRDAAQNEGNFSTAASATTLFVPSDSVNITKAEYKADRLEFKVEATSSDGGNVTLTVLGFGAMDYDSRKDKYKFRVKPVELPPCTAVVVSSGGGSDARDTGASPCGGTGDSGGTGDGGGTDDASDLQSISSRYKDLVMGGSDSDVPGYRALLNGSGRFTDINYGATSRDSGWDVAVHLERSLALAQAYEREGGAYYQDASLRDDVFSTISGWISGTPSNVNWWWSTIGWPKTASEVGVIMKDALKTHNNSLRNSLVSYLKSASWNKIGNQAGANATDVQLVGLAACAIGDDHNLCETVVNSMLSTINYKTGNNDGLMTDLSFTQHNYHGRQLYHNGYANVYIYGFLNIATVVRDSSLRVPESKDTLIEEFFLGGVEHLIYGEHYSDILVSGRGYAKNPTYAPNSKIWRWPLERLIDYGTARKAELEVLLDRMMGVTPENTVANKMFWHTDFMTHTRPNYYTSVRGTSTRTVGNESLKGTGKLSYHMGDGVNMVLHHGDEYETILPVWDWRRLPGTTIEQRTGSLPLVEGGTGGAGGNSYAGGVSDGKYGAYGFIFNEGSQNANVGAYKAHFFFDDEFVALGAGVSAPNAGNPVVTTVNQTLHKSGFTVGGTVTQQTHFSGSVALAKDDWVHHYDIGYLMLDHYGSTSASVAWQSGRLSDHTDGLSDNLLSESVFSLGIDHGQGFSNKTYGYVVVPGVTVSQMSDYAANSPIQVLSNTTTVQAVHHLDLDITSALFYQSGSLTMADGSTLTSDKAVAVLVKKAGPYVMVSVASPQYSSMTAKITLEGELTGDNVSYNSDSDVSTITFSLASGNDKGRTVTHALTNPYGS